MILSEVVFLGAMQTFVGVLASILVLCIFIDRSNPLYRFLVQTRHDTINYAMRLEADIRRIHQEGIKSKEYKRWKRSQRRPKDSDKSDNPKVDSNQQQSVLKAKEIDPFFQSIVVEKSSSLNLTIVPKAQNMAKHLMTLKLRGTAPIYMLLCCMALFLGDCCVILWNGTLDAVMSAMTMALILSLLFWFVIWSRAVGDFNSHFRSAEKLEGDNGVGKQEESQEKQNEADSEKKPEEGKDQEGQEEQGDDEDGEVRNRKLTAINFWADRNPEITPSQKPGFFFSLWMSVDVLLIGWFIGWLVAVRWNHPLIGSWTLYLVVGIFIVWGCIDMCRISMTKFDYGYWHTTIHFLLLFILGSLFGAVVTYGAIYHISTFPYANTYPLVGLWIAFILLNGIVIPLCMPNYGYRLIRKRAWKEMNSITSNYFTNLSQFYQEKNAEKEKNLKSGDNHAEKQL